MFLNCFSMMYPVMIFAIHYNLSFSVAHIDVHTKLNSPLYINILYIHIYIYGLVFPCLLLLACYILCFPFFLCMSLFLLR